MNKDINLESDWKFPSTRYAGSKKRLIHNIYDIFNGLEFECALDVFCGTSSVSYLLKKMGKTVFANDLLHSNYWTSVALIENDNITLSERDILDILPKKIGEHQWNFIASKFKNFYFTDEENQWLDDCIYNIDKLGEKYDPETTRYKKAIALHSLFQSALRKRPFNMFHRRNLYLRLASVERQFGNYTTWSTPFEEHFRKLVKETNSYVFSNGLKHNIYREDARTWISPPVTDLVYIDPPYVWSGASRSEVNYLVKYHFLEGLARYEDWPKILDENSYILQVKDGYKEWPGANQNDIRELIATFESLITKYKDRIIVLSYREPGIPSIAEIIKIIKKMKNNIYVAKWPYSYALRKPSTKIADCTQEVIIVGTDGDYFGPGEKFI